MPNFGLSGIGALLTGGSIADATTGASGGNAAVWGTKPKTADYVPVDLATEIGGATNANLANMDSINALLERILPGFTGMLQQAGKNNSALMRGEVPQDVINQVQRNSAYKSLMGGYGGSGMAHALTARDLGRTSLELQQVGGNSAQQWAQSAQQAYSPWLVSAQEYAGNTRANNAGQQAYQQRVFDVAAAPDPAAAGKFAIDSAIGMNMLNFGMGAAGMGMGGGGGVPQQQQPQYGGTFNYGAYPPPQQGYYQQYPSPYYTGGNK